MTKPLPDMMDCFAELIAIPSVSSTDPAFDMTNRAMVETLANWFGDLGMDTELIPVPGSAVEKFNLVARMGEGADGLVLSGHTDTVPYNEAGWSSDPFILTEFLSPDHRGYTKSGFKKPGQTAGGARHRG